ncbi:MAG: hypothetical protein HF314_14750 [Ignavibacteria bacterium]|jgi:hypothetical protein|nr:hypothetical protein [Ignavibacteria bacterium]MCU7504338.1 hypothetical protein [Ignavibacteria bacterium]MCU7518183.1 hypothetical protein [Ignavibacteria bacterium]
MMSKEALLVISNFFPGSDSSGAKEFDLFDEDKFRKDALDMGDHVTYISGKRQSAKGKEGYIVTYSFSDIDKVKIGQNPSRIVRPPETPELSDTSSNGEEYISFDLDKNDPSTLRINLPSEEFQESKKEQLESAVDTMQIDTQMEQKIKNMMSDMKMAFVVNVPGLISESNATYREGSKITLAEIDFGKLIENPENYRRFISMKNKPFPEVKKFLSTIPGIKIELNNKVEVKFR